MTNKEVAEAIRDVVVATVTDAVFHITDYDDVDKVHIKREDPNWHWCGLIINGDVDVDVTAGATDPSGVDWTPANNYTAVNDAATQIISLLQA